MGIDWTAYAIVYSLPYWTDDKLTSWIHGVCLCLTSSAVRGTFFHLRFCGAQVFLSLAPQSQNASRTSAVSPAVFTANTLGGIAGALGVSLWLIPWIGTAHSEQVLLALSALSGLLVLAPLVRERARSASLQLAGGLTVSLVVAGLLGWNIGPIPGELIAYGRRMRVNAGQSQILYTAEGINSSVAISRWLGGAVYVNLNGHVEATTEPCDMKLLRMVGHLQALLHPQPLSVLGIGFGAGVSAGAFTRYPTIQKITICEIEPVIPRESTRFFAREDYNVLNHPRTHMIYDDARHYLLTTTEKFDVIASDPLDVFIKAPLHCIPRSISKQSSNT